MTDRPLTVSECAGLVGFCLGMVFGLCFVPLLRALEGWLG